MSESDISNLRAQLAEQQAELLAVRADITALGERVPVPSDLAAREAEAVVALERSVAELQISGTNASLGTVVVQNQAPNQGVQGTFYAPVMINSTSASEPLKALHQLRAPVADFVGREDAVFQLVAALRTGPGGRAAAISGVRGMGGIGKTELAYVVATQFQADYPDAQLLLELRGASDVPLSPAQALQQVISAFRPEEKLPEDLSVLQAVYHSMLAGRRVLILADDAKDAAQVRPLQTPAGCALLVTSRQHYMLDGMTALDLDCLDEAAAVHLLRGICARLEEDQARQIAWFCGGLPLALRVSAGILANDLSLSITRYLTQLANERCRLAQLRDPDDPARDVAAIMHLSYAVLDQTTQTAFRQLGVLAADADLGLIAAVLDQNEEETETVLRLLLRRSLVEYDAARERWDLHDLVRVFALERLAEEGKELVVRLHYAERVIQVIKQAEQRYLEGGVGVLEGLALFDRERAHREVVREWLWAQPSTPEIDTLVWNEAFTTPFLEELRDSAQTVRVPRWHQAVAAARRLSDRRGEGSALGNLGLAHADLGETRTAITYYEQHLTIAQEVGDRCEEGMALGNLGNAYADLGEARIAITYYEQDLAIAREMGNRRGEGITLGNLGNAYLDLGETHTAVIYYEQQLTIAREVGDRREEGMALGCLGLAYVELGETHTAIGYHEQCLNIMREVGDRRGEGITLGNLGTAHEVLGNLAEALACCEASLALAQKSEDRSLEGTVLHDLANVQATLGQPAEAAVNYAISLFILKEIGDEGEVSHTCWDYGQFLIRQGERERGIALMAECVAYEQRIGHAKADEHAALVDSLRAGGSL